MSLNLKGSAFRCVAASFFLAGSMYAQKEPSKLSKLPLETQSPISAKLGRTNLEYLAIPSHGGFDFRNREQRITAHFHSRGMELEDGTSHWGLRLRGFGYNSIRILNPTAPIANVNRIEYRRGPIKEWYVNGPLGIEQGFTISKRLAVDKKGPLTVALETSGDLHACINADGSGLQLNRETSARLIYTNLSARDSGGRLLPSHLELRENELLIRVEDSNAVYPLTIDPIIQLAQLTITNGTNNDLAGYSVAVSGNTIAVGAPNANDGTNKQAGAVYVFVRPKTGWVNLADTAKLTGSNGVIPIVGYAVAIDGDTIVTGAQDPNTGQYVLLVFVKPPGGWKDMVQSAELTVTDASSNASEFTSIRVNNNTIVAGSGLSSTFNFEGGEAYLYVKPTNGWADMSQTAILSPSDKQEDNFGTSISISGDTVVVGAPGNGTFNFSQVGAAYIFVEPSGGWVDMTETAELTASDGMPFDRLGASVSISGNTVIAGSPFAKVGSSSMQGAAYVFTEPAGGWQEATETAKLTIAAGKGNSQFGTSVAISGNSVVIGAPKVTVGSNAFQGAAFLYVKPGSGWKTTSHATSFMTAGSTDSNFGQSVAMGGGVIVAGSPVGFVGKTKAPGTAYVFGQPTSTMATRRKSSHAKTGS